MLGLLCSCRLVWSPFFCAFSHRVWKSAQDGQLRENKTNVRRKEDVVKTEAAGAWCWGWYEASVFSACPITVHTYALYSVPACCPCHQWGPCWGWWWCQWPCPALFWQSAAADARPPTLTWHPHTAVDLFTDGGDRWSNGRKLDLLWFALRYHVPRWL